MHDNQMDAIEPEVLVPTIAPERLELLPGVATSAITPLLIAEAGKLAEKAYWEYFVATIRNKNTRMAYARQVVKFVDWCTNARFDHGADRAASCRLISGDFSGITAEL